MRRLELDMKWQSSEDFAKHLRRASTPAEDMMWQLVRNRQRYKAKFRRQHRLGHDTQRVLLTIDTVLKTLLKQVAPPHPSR